MAGRGDAGRGLTSSYMATPSMFSATTTGLGAALTLAAATRKSSDASTCRGADIPGHGEDLAYARQCQSQEGAGPEGGNGVPYHAAGSPSRRLPLPTARVRISMGSSGCRASSVWRSQHGRATAGERGQEGHQRRGRGEGLPKPSWGTEWELSAARGSQQQPVEVGKWRWSGSEGRRQASDEVAAR